MPEEKQHTYDFGVASNSYFQGSDGIITRDDGKSIKIQRYDNCLAVNVKDYSFGVNESIEDKAVLAKLNDLNKHSRDHFLYGQPCSYEDALYERVKEQWWHDAEWMTEEDEQRPVWVKGVHSAGRSGGWCVIEGSEWLSDNFLSGDEQPDWMNDDDFEAAIQRRTEFLELAFDLVENIEQVKDGIATDIILEDHAELEERRAENINPGDN